MEFREALMKLVVHKTPAHHREFFQISEKQKEKVASTKQNWKILFQRSSSDASISKSSRSQHHRVQPKSIPQEFFCPISGSLMAEPVIVSSGHTFERACVEACKKMEFAPVLNDGSIPDFSTVISNLALKSTIFNWCQNHSLNPPKPLDFSKAEELVRTLLSQQPKTQIDKEGKSVKNGYSVKSDHSATELSRSNSEEKSVATAASTTTPIMVVTLPLKLDYAVTELTRSSSEVSVTAAAVAVVTPPLKLEDRPSCHSSASSSSEIETVKSPIGTTPSINEEEESFLTKLKSSQVFDIEEALNELRRITRTQVSSRAVLCTPRVLSAFRSLISSRYVNIQVNSVAVLVNLSLEKMNKVKIVRSGLVPDLIDVLKSGSPEAQEHACGALFSLALDDHNKTAIGVLGALQPLMHMLRSGTERARHDSALALYHLSLVQTNRSKLVKIGSVPVFLSMIRSGQMTGRVFLVLGNLASGTEGRAALLDSGAVECLLSVLRGSELDESTREGCVTVLYGLSHAGLRFKGLAMAGGALEELAKVERTSSGSTREKARRMLEMLNRRSEEEQEEVDWEALLDSGLKTRTRFRLGGGKDGSCINSSEF